MKIYKTNKTYKHSLITAVTFSVAHPLRQNYPTYSPFSEPLCGFYRNQAFRRILARTQQSERRQAVNNSALVGWVIHSGRGWGCQVVAWPEYALRHDLLLGSSINPVIPKRLELLKATVGSSTSSAPLGSSLEAQYLRFQLKEEQAIMRLLSVFQLSLLNFHRQIYSWRGPEANRPFVQRWVFLLSGISWIGDSVLPERQDASAGVIEGSQNGRRFLQLSETCQMLNDVDGAELKRCSDVQKNNQNSYQIGPMGDKTNNTFSKVSAEVKGKINFRLVSEFNKLALSDTSSEQQSVCSGLSNTRRSDNWAQPIDVAPRSEYRSSGGSFHGSFQEEQTHGEVIVEGEQN